MRLKRGDGGERFALDSQTRTNATLTLSEMEPRMQPDLGRGGR